ncbi:bifunctional helix-turn-helix transcriptional regulator/GNAT family N-acetyltransferase [Novosphingobium beihaiensis]|uniref:Bifunctional helix-turn-helix transcriptional regulator/GNAT family N-acetyltransferase n=1 Tax=Novosphingobium beihaiensis TaxID=2930389 RepID=A0ABT0BJL7_9SPHN|nr:bifunctional helix-turn-helix transcriptional regulator/GNAT family N-acetyltransferase [Novosphingobium beihaiensis]MCJ2185240.1 bifunctional helix-turn-helix transcriptional regulator/GNAT family N-acetyltransferase [Novosphingobium beihaiensis]
MTDAVAKMGPLFLATRLKRLGERMQAGAAAIIAESGLPLLPAHMPVLAMLDRKAMTVGQLAEAVGTSQPGVTRIVGQLAKLGFVTTAPCTDQRQRLVSLTGTGEAAMIRTKLQVWPRVGRAAELLCEELGGDLMARIAEIEAALARQSLESRARAVVPDVLSLREFSDDLARHFHDINAEWITAMFQLEQTDRDVLENPRAAIVDPGGVILFVEAEGLGIVGTCALQKTAGGGFELTKMGVRESARGLKAGEFLLSAAIQRAQAMQADPLYLLTNKRCEAAIHLYEKLGFRHDAEIMARYGARYARCDVAMRFVEPDAPAASSATFPAAG